MAEKQAAIEDFSWLGAGAIGLLGGGFIIWHIIGDVAEHPLAVLAVAAAILAALRNAKHVVPERFAEVIERACQLLGFGLVRLFVWYFALMPGLALFVFSHKFGVYFPLWFQGVTLAAWILLLVLIALLLYWRAFRRHVSEWRWVRALLRWAGVLEAPSATSAILLYLNLVFFAIGGFAAFAWVLHQAGQLRFLRAGRDVDLDAIDWFFIWQLVDAIPSLKLPETWDWEKPLDYERTTIGWVVVLFFRVVVIMPVVAGIGHYLKEADRPKEDSKPRPD